MKVKPTGFFLWRTGFIESFAVNWNLVIYCVLFDLLNVSNSLKQLVLKYLPKFKVHTVTQ